MTAELGLFALALTLPLALVLATLPLVGARRGDARLMALAPAAAGALLLFTATAFASLVLAFVTHDFSVVLVARHSSEALPIGLRIAAVWGSHEGSMLLWLLMLAGWSAAVAAWSGTLEARLRARVLAVMGWVAAGFTIFVLATSNPFERQFPPARVGSDLNPLLQDPAMILHPPLLYMGYVGLAVAFAFSVGGLIDGRIDSRWARSLRPWVMLAWAFLTVGIALGSFWAYYELGWGGWWFWDPVENASLMPWLVTTALMHSLAATDQRSAFPAWSALLAILAFGLSLLGTLLVRSGILTSVHAFASDPDRGFVMLVMLALAVGAGLLLFGLRAPAAANPARLAPTARESLLLANNVVLLAATGAVLLGTLLPLVLETLGAGRAAVDPSYFDTVFPLLTAPALILMAAGPLAQWSRGSMPQLAARLRWALAIALLFGLATPPLAWLAGAPGAPLRPLTALGIAVGAWIIAGTLLGLRRGPPPLPASPADPTPTGGPRRVRPRPASFWGMQLAHLGVAIFVIGVTVVRSYEIEVQTRARPGDAFALGGYTVRFHEVARVPGPNYMAIQGRFTVHRSAGADDAPIATLLPERRVYLPSGLPMTEAAIERSPRGDLYVAITEPGPDAAWTVRAHLKPLVNWIWIGCLTMAAGGLVAASDRRYRRPGTSPAGPTHADRHG